jgi:MoaA/NifB/PqqE/SkfB family radical SAM enzyme
MSTMCQHPWQGIDISPQGEFKPCCKYIDTVATNLKDYLNSAELFAIKEDFLAGKKPKGCQRCWDDEDAGLPSKRQIDQQLIYNHANQTGIKVLSLPFGNSCNLACRTCNSEASSGWISESKKLQQHIPSLKIYQHQRFYQDSEFIAEIKKISTDVALVQFPGGEPFIAGINEHLDFLDYLLENSKNISLHYVTNATIFPDERFWNRWQKFKNVDIQLSIDGIDSHFEYNRWPAEWSKVNQHVDQYITKRETNTNIQISISHTVSIFTVYYLPEFVKWCLQKRLGKPYLGLVSNPNMYDIRCLPTSVKDGISEKLRRFKFSEIVLYMYSQNLPNEVYAQAQMYTDLLDQQRGQNFSKIFPEFYQLLKDAACQI